MEPELRRGNFLLLSATTAEPGSSPDWLVARDNHGAYAKSMGYRYQLYHTPQPVTKDAGGKPTYGPHWYKVLLMLRAMEDPENKVLVWLDIDLVITNVDENMLERYMEVYRFSERAHLLVTEDTEEHALLNTGVMVVRNTPEARALLRAMLRAGAENGAHLATCEQDCLHEQQALKDLVTSQRLEHLDAQGPRCRWAPGAWKEALRYAPLLAVVPQRSPLHGSRLTSDGSGMNLNTFRRGAWQQNWRQIDPPASQWRDGDFAGHCLGLRGVEKPRCVRDLLHWVKGHPLGDQPLRSLRFSVRMENLWALPFKRRG